VAVAGGRGMANGGRVEAGGRGVGGRTRGTYGIRGEGRRMPARAEGTARRPRGGSSSEPLG
jgi:hypothetical protein